MVMKGDWITFDYKYVIFVIELFVEDNDFCILNINITSPCFGWSTK